MRLKQMPNLATGVVCGPSNFGDSIEPASNDLSPFENYFIPPERDLLGPKLPPSISIAEIESHLDRVALAISASPYGEEYLPLYTWLERQLTLKRRRQQAMSMILERVKRLRDRKVAPC